MGSGRESIPVFRRACTRAHRTSEVDPVACFVESFPGMLWYMMGEDVSAVFFSPCSLGGGNIIGNIDICSLTTHTCQWNHSGSASYHSGTASYPPSVQLSRRQATIYFCMHRMLHIQLRGFEGESGFSVGTRQWANWGCNRGKPERTVELHSSRPVLGTHCPRKLPICSENRCLDFSRC